MVGTTSLGTELIYGANACKRWSAFKSSPRKPPAAVRNADSYAWFAASKFWSNKLGFVFTRDALPETRPNDTLGDAVGNATLQAAGEKDDHVAPDQEDGSSVGSDFLEDDPAVACGKVAQAVADDCANIDVTGGLDFVDFGSACWSQGSNKWCDVYTFETCQVSV